MFKMDLRTETEAFKHGHFQREVSYILRKISEAIDAGQVFGACKDSNGVIVGTWECDDPRDKPSHD
jgi:hypothetical protein